MNSATGRFSVVICIIAALLCLSVFADEMQPIVLGDDPQPPDVDLTFQGYAGDVISPITVFILNPYQRAWRVAINGFDLVHQDNPDHIVSADQVHFRDVKAPTAWADYGGNITNVAAHPHMKIEMLIALTGTEAPGYYVGDAVLEWMVWPAPGSIDMLVGTLTLRLHLNIPEMLEVSIDDEEMVFPEHAGDLEGWLLSENRPTLTVRSNRDFNLSISSGDDLTCTTEGGATRSIPFALRMWMPEDTGDTWQTWGDMGDVEHGQVSHPWAQALQSSASPWPGLVQSVQTAGVNTIGIEGAAWRSGLADPVGDYTSTVVLTISVP
jgi:hypothetical protein